MHAWGHSGSLTAKTGSRPERMNAALPLSGDGSPAAKWTDGPPQPLLPQRDMLAAALFIRGRTTNEGTHSSRHCISRPNV
jgi:hypothetical protein